MRPVFLRAIWTFDALVVAAGVATGLLLVGSIRLTVTTVDRTSDWNHAVGDVKLEAALSYAWLEAAARRSPPAGAARSFATTVDAARSRCRDLQRSAPQATEVARLCGDLDSFRAASLGRLRRGAAGGTAYAATFASSMDAIEPAERAVDGVVARERSRLLRIDATLALVVLLVFAGVAVAVSRRARSLASQNERLRRIDRLKDDFVAAVSHELRTPLAATIGFLQTLERADLELDDAERRELTGIARTQAERLARRVTDLLFVSEVDSGRLVLDYANVDIAALSVECIEALQPLATEKGVRLELDADTVPVRGDRARLAQLLDNVVSNALKFTPRNGEIRILARAESGRARLEVSDTGVGIPHAEQARVFDRFYRTTSAADDAVPGTGLGLSIVKAIVDAHQGAVSVESREAAGTTIRVELPLVPA
jgi:signal transduction histidine kinase